MSVSKCYRALAPRLLLRPSFALSPTCPAPPSRRLLSNARPLSQQHDNNFSAGYNSEYSPPGFGNGRGPIFDRKEAPPLYPKDIKKRVDAYVVGQEKAKRVISVAFFNHMKRCIRAEHHEELQRTLEAHHTYQLHSELIEPWHPRTEDRLIPDRADFQPPGLDREYVAPPPQSPPPPPEVGSFVRDDESAGFVKIDKHNLLFLGPTGSGKTYLLETLSKILDLPIVICDCNALTQAGYIGQDVETCIQRLLIEAGFDVQKAQRGIVVLDEFDKLAKRETTMGRDVAGEGVQQALLAMVHGSKVTVNIKDAQKPAAQQSSSASFMPPFPPSSSQQSLLPAAKTDQQFVVDTSNIVFVFCGAFAGLDRVIRKRVSKTSMGFGTPESDQPATESSRGSNGSATVLGKDAPSEAYFDLAIPEDLQAYGIIPELLGRIHDICALRSLSLDELYRILTEPRNNLVAQYQALFETYPSQVFFTRKSLRAIAKRAADSKKGARGLQSEMLRVLRDAMFMAPVPYILVTEACIEDPDKLHYWGKDGRMELERMMRDEDGDEGLPVHVEQSAPAAAAQGGG